MRLTGGKDNKWEGRVIMGSSCSIGTEGESPECRWVVIMVGGCR